MGKGNEHGDNRFQDGWLPIPEEGRDNPDEPTRPPRAFRTKNITVWSNRGDDRQQEDLHLILKERKCHADDLSGPLWVLSNIRDSRLEKATLGKKR
ncbi:hypothetical protein Trydic_g13754 [Trypoxylus dichotomus]